MYTGGWVGELVVDRDRLTYTGALAPTALHHHHAFQVVTSPGVTLEDARGDRRTVTAAVIPPEAPHRIAAPYAAVVLLYLDGDTAATLFVDASSVFESGGVEGTFAHYAEHHLGPEMAAIERFVIRAGEPDVLRSADGSLALVTYAIEYDIDLADRAIMSQGTVTFVLVSQGTRYAIRHLHWSSRPRRGPSEGH